MLYRMHGQSNLLQAFVLLAAAVVLVPLFRRLKFGSVLGYLAAGVIVGPSGLRLVEDVGDILSFSELGVVLLLFVIGIELKPSRLWLMRREVFGLGALQVVATAVLIGAALRALGTGAEAAVIIGFGLALSSTAFAMQLLSERHELNTKHGRGAFAVLLFQDLAVVPFLALLPMLGTAPAPDAPPLWVQGGMALGAIALLVLASRLLVRPLFKAIAATRAREVFTAAALFIVLGTALLMQFAGLSMGLGAFLAGMLLADSEFRHQLEADIEPFRGLLLGLFFVAVGMSVDVSLIRTHWLLILSGVPALMAVKTLVTGALARIFGYRNRDAASMGALLSQGGEFGFVLFALAAANGFLPRELAGVLTASVTASMALTPLAVWAQGAAARRFSPEVNPYAGEAVENEGNPVIIAGFGRVGQIVGKILATQKIGYTTLDPKPEQIQLSRQFGYKIYYGDATRADLLHAAGADQAKLLVVAVDDVEAAEKIIEVAQREFPHLKIIARARNRVHALKLREYEIEYVIRETFESSLKLGDHALRLLGYDKVDSKKIVADFKQFDYETLNSTIRNLVNK